MENEGWCWPFWLQSTKTWTLFTFTPILYWNLQLKPLHEYAYRLSLKCPHFCCSGTLLWERHSVFSLLAANNKSLLLPIFGLVVYRLNTHQEVTPVFRQWFWCVLALLPLFLKYSLCNFNLLFDSRTTIMTADFQVDLTLNFCYSQFFFLVLKNVTIYHLPS